MIIAGCQRWRERRESYVPAREPFNPRAHEVAPLAQDLAKAFVEANHYSGSCSARTRQFGLYSGSDVVGVAVFGEPGGPKVKAILPCPAAQTLELGRLVLLEGVLANAESWFVARCFDQLRRAGYGGVISFADPLPRTTIAGKVVFGGHAGTIYQSLNAVYTGHGSRDTQYLLPDGRTFNKRAASKIRKRETGWRYAVEQLVAAGAREPAEGEDSRYFGRCRRVRESSGNR